MLIITDDITTSQSVLGAHNNDNNNNNDSDMFCIPVDITVLYTLYGG